jgi:hypothetical protein
VHTCSQSIDTECSVFEEHVHSILAYTLLKKLDSHPAAAAARARLHGLAIALFESGHALLLRLDGISSVARKALATARVISQLEWLKILEKGLAVTPSPERDPTQYTAEEGLASFQPQPPHPRAGVRDADGGKGAEEAEAAGEGEDRVLTAADAAAADQQAARHCGKGGEEAEAAGEDRVRGGVAEGGVSRSAGGGVTAFEVTGKVDYERLIRQWGSHRIDQALIERIERLSGQRAHHLLRRGFFFSHRDFDKVLDAYEKGEPFYLYTGRGPSSRSLHVGHLVPFLLTQWLQEAFRVPVVIQVTDDEKFLWKGGDLETYREFALSNIRDIMAVGFLPELTYVLVDTEKIGQLYPNALRIQRLIGLSTAKAVFGFDDSSSVGQIAFPALQIAPALSSTFPQLFPSRPDMWCLGSHFTCYTN